jgi:hypothetical protein
VPIEMNLWRIQDDRPVPVALAGIGEEKRLESIIADDSSILGLGPLLLVGRQVATDFGGRIDLLAIDEDGTTYVIELKRGRTPREVVAQVLDYGAWARDLSADRLTRIFETGPFASGRTFQAAFADQYGGPPPATINEAHRLVIVAAELDASTQRIIEYLLDAYGVPVNAVFFMYFRDGDAEYLGRSWLKDPQAADEQARDREPKRTPGEWNGTDYYVQFGDDQRRSWEDARTWNYVAAGGGQRWSGPLRRLPLGARVFVHHPHDGYVGVGQVLQTALPITDFHVTRDGRQVPIVDVPLHNEHIKDDADDPERCEYLVPVRWEWTAPAGEGLWQTGFFSRRLTATKLCDPLTSRRICAHADIPYDEFTRTSTTA